MNEVRIIGVGIKKEIMKVYEIITICLFCFYLIWLQLNRTSERREEKQRTEDAVLSAYGLGYSQGALAGAKLIANDTLSFKDWLEMKRQDSIKFKNSRYERNKI